ncbi:MAG: capsule polysaccharide transporter [Bacteroidia bacterium]|nr:MAG: capsule polysaccharide transporter [Bacteroidia bacterium]
MSGEEIEAKLGEMGMTRWEAIRRAQDQGITLEQFLQATEKRPLRRDELAADTSRKTRLQDIVKGPERELKQPSKVFVPGFTGRFGVDSTLKPFGFDVFTYPSSTFEPVLNMATPPSYALGPGDEIVITVWGETKLYHQLEVNREGNVIVPDVGPVSANGQTVEQFRERLLRRMSEVYSGLNNGRPGANTFLDVSLGKLRTIQVFVLGLVKQPGGYTLSSVSTVLHALYLAGGPTVEGGLRNIGIVRGGRKNMSADLYEYLVTGNRTGDIRLQDGDVVYVYPAAKRVAIIGNVVRPAIYELGEKETLKDLLEMGGGTRFNTDFRRIHIERIVPFEQREKYPQGVLDIDVSFKTLAEFKNASTPLEDGDVVSVYRMTTLPENRVFITGSVNKPGPFAYRSGMRISDLIAEADSLARGTFMERGLLFRMLPNLRRQTKSFNLQGAMEGHPEDNLELANEDSVVLFREKEFRPVRSVAISGAVAQPDYYTRHEGMTVHDLVLLAGGLMEDASTSGWEISRLDTSELGVYTRIIKLEEPFEYGSDIGAGRVELHDFDYVFVPSDPRFTPQKFVEVRGYVMFPGPYPIRYEGEKLADIIQRAGGLRPGAYLEGSRFYRKGVAGERVLTGQIPIDFRSALGQKESRDNIVMYEGDSVYISYFEDVVRVYGEVFVPSAILYKQGEDEDYYIEQAGGLKDEADESRIYVLLPGGKKWESGDILPGSAVYVPKKVEKEDKTLPVLRDLATILASLAAITIGIIQVTK